jgi:hypothetical protein
MKYYEYSSNKSWQNRKKNKKEMLNIPSFCPPLGLQYNGNVLENNGHIVEIIGYCLEEYSTNIPDNSLIRADFIGSRVYIPNICSTIEDV